MKEVNFEGKAPHGVLLFIECATDNNTRTVANVKSILNKNGGEMLTNGSLEFMFSRKAIFEFSLKEGMDLGFRSYGHRDYKSDLRENCKYAY